MFWVFLLNLYHDSTPVFFANWLFLEISDVLNKVYEWQKTESYHLIYSKIENDLYNLVLFGTHAMPLKEIWQCYQVWNGLLIAVFSWVVIDGISNVKFT